MSAFDDIAEDDLRDLHAAAPFARDEVFGQGADIDDKCNELLRITRYIPLEFQPTPRFIKLLQEIWSDAQERERLLSPDRVVAERLADVAQRVLDNSIYLEDFRRCALYLLVKLSARNSLLPRSLFLYGAQLGPDRDVVAGGRFADIYKGSLGTQEVAIKRMRVFAKAESARCRKMLHKEAIVWRQLQHPHVLPFLGLDQRLFPDHDRISMVSPWMDNGTLCQFVKSELYSAKDDCIRLMTEIASGMAYLHSHKVVHGDIHGANVLIDRDRHAKLADFGLCVIGEATAGRLTQTTSNTGAGHICYLAPERFIPETQGNRWRAAVDVYAFACMCILLLTSCHPFQEMRERSEYAVMIAVGKGDRPVRPKNPDCLLEPTDDIWMLIQDCWQQEPDARPDMISVYKRIHQIPRPQFISPTGIHPVDDISQHILKAKQMVVAHTRTKQHNLTVETTASRSQPRVLMWSDSEESTPTSISPISAPDRPTKRPREDDVLTLLSSTQAVGQWQQSSKRIKLSAVRDESRRDWEKNDQD